MREDVFPIGMEHLPARDATGVRVSLEMVDKADIYIGIYAWRYGWVPTFDNPEKISVTEMEFNRALARKQRGELKEILVFVMHDDHPIRASDKEDGEEAQRKLKEFKQRASEGRVMLTFESSQELRGQIIQSLAAFKRNNETRPQEDDAPAPTAVAVNSIPTPPAFYAEPDYIGSHRFVGRESQLQDISDWAKAAAPTNLLLFEAIGGNGKSMLTWEWVTNPNHATQVRDDWAGRFWYSFYERGAIMADFCQRALAYMTGQPLRELRKKKTAELREPLLAQIHARPWLLILDGLERVLVAYHRIDAAEMPDEEANNPTDKIVNRDPRDAIRDEDNDLLRALAAATPSKILVSSRLTPRVLLNPSGQPITGAKRITLPGLRPSDAERLLRSCGIEGDSAAIQSYLTTNCDNHPLVIGILGGLINNYLPARGNFDAWAADPDGGAKLDLASLDLIQRRNHILRAALDALSPTSHQLLSTLALLPESVDYETLCAFDPHDPPDSKKLAVTVTDLEQRGLMQYDGRTRRHDLHPVVRGVAAGGMKVEDKERYGRRIVDHFSTLPHNPYDKAETLEDLRPGLNVVRTLLKLGHFREAARAFGVDLFSALLFNIEAYAETLSLLRPFFPIGWSELPKGVTVTYAASLAHRAAMALQEQGESREALATNGAALASYSEAADWRNAYRLLGNISANLDDQNLLAKALRVDYLALDLAVVRGDQEDLFGSRLDLFLDQSRFGKWADAEATWQLLDPMGRDWSRATYRPGDAEFEYARFQYWKGSLQEKHLTAAEGLAAEGKNRGAIRSLHELRGAWRLERGEWQLALASFAEGVRLARDSGIPDAKIRDRTRPGQAPSWPAHRAGTRGRATGWAARARASSPRPTLARPRRPRASEAPRAGRLQMGLGRRRAVCAPLRTHQDHRTAPADERAHPQPPALRPGQG